MKPFFTYYGGKWRAAPKYPAPKHRTVIEPFAGAAGYATRHYQRDVVLYDKSEMICALWSYLIKVSAAEVLSLPTLVSHVDDYDLIPEAKYLIGFWLNKGSAAPRKSASSWARSGIRPHSYWGETIRARIAMQVDLIRHWQVTLGSYADVENVEATWFVDPPYQGHAGSLYPHRLAASDYAHLAGWCEERKGQTIVCEGDGAAWLPFMPFADAKSTPGRRGKSVSKEAVWLNDRCSEASSAHSSQQDGDEPAVDFWHEIQ